MRAKPSRIPDANKASLYAIVVNAIQIAVLAAFVLYAVFQTHQPAVMTVLIATAIMAIWGAGVDIREALKTRRRLRTIHGLQTANDQMDQLNLALRAQRHDFLNHIQVVHSLLEMDESQEAEAYLERIYEELRTVSKVMRTKVTAFNALLQVKNAACEEKGIALEMDIRTTLEGLTVPPWEVCCVMGNLMDNAMDAVENRPDARIRLEVRESLKSFVFTLSNNGAPIPKEMRETIFEPGVSTKGEGRGMGLSIVRKTLAEFGAHIEVGEGEQTSFIVTVPRETRAAVRTEE